MAVIQGRTREQLRQSVGYNLGAMRTSTASGGSTTTVVDNTIVTGGADRFNGRWLVLQDADASTNDGIVRRVTDSSVTSNVYTLTFSPAASASVASSDTYEIWEDKYQPQRINDFINQAIIDATGHAYTYKEDISLHGDGTTARFDIPTSLQMINKFQYRSSVTSTNIHSCGTTFDETTDTEMVQAVDSKDFKRGGSSLKITTSAGNDSFISDSISSLDISGYTHLEGWVKATTAIAAGDFNVCLDNATCTGDGNDKETLAVPAASADTWTFFRVALANPEDDTAIISVGIEQHANSGTNTVWFDDLRVVQNDTAIWTKLDKRAWHIDKGDNSLILHEDGRTALGYRLIKLVGGAKPALLNSDSTANEIDDHYVITRATGMALASAGGGPSTDLDSNAQRAAFWFGLAEQSKRAFPLLVDARMVQ